MVLWVPGVLRSPSPSSDGFVGIDRMVFSPRALQAHPPTRPPPEAPPAHPDARAQTPGTAPAGIFSRRTNQMQEARVYSHDGPIRRRKTVFTNTETDALTVRPRARGEVERLRHPAHARLRQAANREQDARQLDPAKPSDENQNNTEGSRRTPAEGGEPIGNRTCASWTQRPRRERNRSFERAASPKGGLSGRWAVNPGGRR
eukprot:1094473-Prorocentrum_minimum.AAC.1